MKKTVTIRFESEPLGAHLFTKKDNKDLGEVPVEVQLPKDSGKGDALAYVFRLAGYHEVTLVADAHTDRTFHVSLEKLPAPAPAGHRQEAPRAARAAATASAGARGAPSTKTASRPRRFRPKLLVARSRGRIRLPRRTV